MKFHLYKGEKYWKKVMSEYRQYPLIPERHSLLMFLLDNEFKGTMISGKRFHHFILIHDLISYYEIERRSE